MTNRNDGFGPGGVILCAGLTGGLSGRTGLNMAHTHNRLHDAHLLHRLHDAHLLQRAALVLMIAAVGIPFAAAALGAAIYDIGALFGAW